MSAAKKNPPYKFPALEKSTADSQENLRLVKMQAEELRNKLQTRIIDNPAIAKKAALLISLWIQKNTKTAKKK